MTVSLHFRFPAGRYHATAWGHHVNEGAIDWPPAPLRILRALHAQAFRSNADIDRGLKERVLRKLVAAPRYRLPAYTTGHTRHYMPDAGGSPTKVVDAFVAVDPDDALIVEWPDVELDDVERDLLERLLNQLTYLGRAESWCEARLGEPSGATIGPGEEGGGTPVPLLALRRDAPDVLSVLEAETARLRKLGAELPPHTQWIRYFVGPPSSRAFTPTGPPPTAALLLVEASSKPRLVDAVEVAEAIRRRLASSQHPTLSGHRTAGAPRSDQHRHAHYLPFDQEGDGFIRHCLIWAPEGFDQAALEELATFDTRPDVHRPRNDGPLRLTLLEVTQPALLPTLPILGRSKVWVSATPFLLPRFPKVRGGQPVDSPEGQLERELSFRVNEDGKPRFPRVVKLERLPSLARPGGRPPIRWLEFRRWRARGKKPALPQGYGFRIEFEEEVEGPIALGFGAHFGLGLFQAEGS